MRALTGLAFAGGTPVRLTVSGQVARRAILLAAIGAHVQVHRIDRNKWGLIPGSFDQFVKVVVQLIIGVLQKQVADFRHPLSSADVAEKFWK